MQYAERFASRERALACLDEKLAQHEDILEIPTLREPEEFEGMPDGYEPFGVGPKRKLKIDNGHGFT